MKNKLLFGIVLSLFFLLFVNSATANLNDGVVIYMPFENEDCNTVSEIFNHTNASWSYCSPANTNVSGRVNKGFWMNGTNTANTPHINIANSPYMNFQNNNFTLSFWMKPASNKYGSGLLMRTPSDWWFGLTFAYWNGQGRLNSTTLAIAGSSSGTGWNCFNGLDTNTSAKSPEGVINLDQWNFVTVRRTGNVWSVLTNGVNYAINITSSCSLVNNSLDYNFAKWMDGHAWGYFGYMDEFGVWNRSLSDSEITSLYNSGNGLTYPFIIPSTTINLSSPNPTANYNFTATSNIFFNVTANLTYNTNCSLYINGTLNQTNTTYTAGTNVFIGFNQTFPNQKATHNYYIYCQDNTSNTTTSTNTFYLDSILTLDNLTSPLNNTQYNQNYLNISSTINTSRGSLCYLYNNTDVIKNMSTYTTGSLYYNYTSVAEGTYNLSVQCNDSFNSINTPYNLITVDYTDPIISTLFNNTYWTKNLTLVFNATDTNLYSINITDSCNIINYNNSSIGTALEFNQSYDLSNCTYGTKTLNIYVCDGVTSPLHCINNSYTYYVRNRINFSAIDGITSLAIQNFSIYLNSINGTLIGTTDYYYLLADNLTTDNFTFVIDATGYAYANYTINISNTSNTSYGYVFTLYGSNSILFNIYDESTGLPINANNSIRFTSIYGEFTNYTGTNYTFFKQDLLPIEHSLLVSSYGYSPRTYTVTIGNKTTQVLNVYLAINTSTTIFTLYDTDTSELLDNVSVSMYRTINGSWTVIESKYSDISGRIQFTYLPSVNYKFYLSKSGYEDYVFYLDPILFSSYDIKMTKTTLLNYSQNLDGISIIYSPQSFNNNANNTFGIIFASPFGSLLTYGFNITYPNGTSVTASYDTNGVNAIGEQFTTSFNITNATTFDTVRLDYYYQTSIAGRRNFTVFLPINFLGNSTDGNTLMNLKNNLYGMGIFERIFIATLIVLVSVGIATLIGQPLLGLILGLFIFGYLVFIGFLPIWIVLPSLFVSAFFIYWKTGGS